MTSKDKDDPKKAKPAVSVDDDDLDDLDDVLDQFKVPTKPSTSNTNQPGSSSNGKVPNKPEELSDDFTAELAAGMEEMLKSLSMNQLEPGTSADDTNLTQEEKQFRKLWEQMLEDGMNGTEESKAGDQLDAILAEAFKAPRPSSSKAPPPPSSGLQPSAPKAASGSHDNFQDALRQAMDKLKTSDETLNNEADASSDPLAQLLSQMGDLSGDDAGKMDGVIEEMLGAIMSKDVLYEPMQELSTQYPGYLSSHPDLSPGDRKRYEEQLRISRMIVELFERPGYSDDNVKTQSEVFKLMNEMQTLGSPPQEILGDLPEGLSPEALTGGEGCIVS